MPDADNNFGGSLGLDFRKWWRHVQTKNIIIYMFDDNRTGIIICYKHVAIFASDTAYIFGVF